MAPSGKCGEWGAIAVSRVWWESSHVSHRPTGPHKPQGLSRVPTLRVGGGLATTGPANWLPSSQLRFRTECQVPCRVRLVERPRRVATSIMDGQEKQPLRVGVKVQWEVGGSLNLRGSAHCQPKM